MKRTYAPDWRPAKRVKRGADLWPQLRERVLRLHPLCQACGTERSASVHHLVPKGQGGDDEALNLAAVCGDGTRGCHGLIEANDRGTRSRLRSHLTLGQRAYVVERKGDEWFARRYPSEGS